MPPDITHIKSPTINSSNIHLIDEISEASKTSFMAAPGNVTMHLPGASTNFPRLALQIGNLANDGYKLGRQLGVCSRETPYVLHDAAAFGSCSIWRHGGPTAPFVHLVIAFCLLVPKLLMEARLIEGLFLPQGKRSFRFFLYYIL